MKAVDRPSASADRAPRHAAVPGRARIRGHVVSLGLIALLVPLTRWWAAQVLLVPLLVITPGVLLLRALRIPGDVVSSFPVYVPAASIIVLFGSGLAVDIAGPLAGVAAPLRTVPLLVTLEVTCLALLVASVNAPPDVAIPWNSVARPVRLAWPLILPVIAAAGALRLNSGHGNGVALIAVGAVVAVLVIPVVYAARLGDAAFHVILYAASLALLWSGSLRGDGLYGFDIATEYQRLQQTILTGTWHAAHPNDAYGAMLSVTVLPTEIHALSGVPGLLIFKVVYPAIYALFPVAIFDLARRVVSSRWAFLAAAFTIGQYAFTEIAAVARQEIALVLFVPLIAAMLDTWIQRRSRWALVGLLAAAMAVSHYSTTYVAITLCGIAIPLQFALSWFHEIPRITGAVAIAFFAALASAAIWYMPVTSSDSHLLQVAETVQAQGLDLLPNRAPGSGLLAAYLQGNTKTPISAARYEQLVSLYYAGNKPFITPFSNAGLSQYALHDSPVPTPPVKWHAAYGLLGVGLLVIEQLANVVAAVGASLMVLRRKTSIITRQVGVLALVTTLLLTVIRFSGTLAAAYGQERAQLQGLVLLSITLCWAIRGLAGGWRSRQARVLAVTAACLAVVLANTSYLVGAVLGGGTSASLANAGAAYEYFYTSTPELASAQWLGGAVRPGQLVYADEYGQLRLAAVTGLQDGLILDITPQTLNQHAWVYASRTNIIDTRGFALFNNHPVTYVFPVSFLNADYDLVYTDGSSEVFHW
jgi:hypothetical protein